MKKGRILTIMTALFLMIVLSVGVTISESTEVKAAGLGQVKELKVSGSRKKTLTWNKVSGATKYQIYRSKYRDKEFKKIITTENIKYIDEYKNTAYYKVRAIKGTVKGQFSVVKKGIGINEVGKVSNFSVSGSTTKTLTWSKAINATSYEIWKCSTESGSYRKIATTTELQYTHKTSKGYYYKIRGMKESIVGPYSSTVKGRAISVSQVSGLRVSGLTTKKLTWSKAANATQYQIYYASTASGSYTKLATTSNLSYSHKVDKGYYYKVRGVNNDVYGEYSSSVKGTAVSSISTSADFVAMQNKSGGTFVLTQDIKLTKRSQYIILSKPYTYTLDLNGHKLLATFTTSGEITDYMPILVNGSTLKITNSSATKGYITGTELTTIGMTSGKLYTYKNVVIANNNIGYYKENGDTISNLATGITVGGGTYYAYGGNVTGIHNGVILMKGSLFTYGAGSSIYPTFEGKHGNGLYILPSGSTLPRASLAGGTFISKTGSLSGFYPVLDYTNSVLKISTSYAFFKANGSKLSIKEQSYLGTGFKYVDPGYDSSKGWKWTHIDKAK